MPDHTIFFRLLDHADKAAALDAAIAALPDAPNADTFAVASNSLRQVPGTPFAYWASEALRSKFVDFATITDSGLSVKQGLATADDFRFIRLWWEINPNAIVCRNDELSFMKQTYSQQKWVIYAKGGFFSPYYSDLHLMVDWSKDGEVIKNLFDAKVNKLLSRPQNINFYCRPGLTWSRRSQIGFSLRALPEGCIFADKGPSIFVRDNNSIALLCLLGIANSTAFKSLISLQMAFGSYEVGVIQRTVIPNVAAEDERKIANLALQAHDLKRNADCDDEVTHPFGAPTLVRMRGMATIAVMAREYASINDGRERRLAAIQREIDDIAFRLYAISDADRRAIEASLHSTSATPATLDDDDAASTEGTGGDDDDEREAVAPKSDPARLAADLVSYALGCAFGRWDLRIGLDTTLAPQLADPFAPLPVCAPGTLVGADGLPARTDGIVSASWLRARPDTITLPLDDAIAQPTIADADYPLTIAWDGILVDDPIHSRDVIHAVRRMLDRLWGDRAGTIEDELCALLGVPDLRAYLRAPSGFFDYHLKRYSKSRRKAPIYWLLQSPKKLYGVWIYYHRLDRDLLSKVLAIYVRPRLESEQQTLVMLQADLTAATAADERRRAKTAVEKQQALLTDLIAFEERLARAVQLDLTPDLNDGVILNCAPLWELTPWREAKAAWAQLIAGKYTWSAIGQHLRASGRVK